VSKNEHKYPSKKRGATRALGVTKAVQQFTLEGFSPNDVVFELGGADRLRRHLAENERRSQGGGASKPHRTKYI